DGRAVACGNAVQLFDLDTGHELSALRHPASVARVDSVTWHPDGSRLATGCDDGKIRVWHIETGTEIMSLSHQGDNGLAVTFNSTGDHLASVGWDGDMWIWDALTGRLLLKMPDSFLQFDTEGHLLGRALSSSRIRRWRLAYGRELRVLRGRGAEGLHLARPVTHPDGRTLAAFSYPRGLSLFDLATGEQLASVRLPHEE